MKITVKLFATFRNGREKVQTVDLPESSTPDKVLGMLDISRSGVAILLINGRDGSFDSSLKENDIISLFPPIGGG